MKKFLALLLAALMVLAMFTACAKTETPSQEETTAPTETAEPAAPAGRDVSPPVQGKENKMKSIYLHKCILMLMISI